MQALVTNYKRRSLCAGLALLLLATSQPSFAGTASSSSPNSAKWKPQPCAECKPTLLLPVPGVRQHTNYSCGEAALLSVLAYFGIDVRQDTLTEQTKTTYDFGTNYKDIVRVAKEYGLEPEVVRGMKPADLIEKVKQGSPVILAMQAWLDNGDPRDLKNWTSNNDDGHYVVAIGYDDKRIYFADPSIFYIGYIPFEELDARWHEKYTDEDLDHVGIVMAGGSHKPITGKEYVPID